MWHQGFRGRLAGGFILTLARMPYLWGFSSANNIPNTKNMKTQIFTSVFSNIICLSPSQLRGKGTPPLRYLVSQFIQSASAIAGCNCPSPTRVKLHPIRLQQPPFSQILNKSDTMATTAYPPGGTFLDTLKKSFTDVPVDKEKENAVSTTEFLEAAESLTTLFGSPPAFSICIQI